MEHNKNFVDFVDKYKIFSPLAMEQQYHLSVKYKTIEMALSSMCLQYDKNPNKNTLIDCGAMVYCVYLDKLISHEAKCTQVIWSKLLEFQKYSITQKIRIYIEIWKRTNNLIFLTEIYELVANEYEG